MRILILSQYFYPEIGGAAERIFSIARYLKAYNHQVTVLTGFPNYPKGIIPAKYRGKTLYIENIEETEVIRSWLFTSSNRNSLCRLLNYLSFMCSAAITGIRLEKKYDILLVSSPPLFLGLTAVFLSRKFSIPWVLDLRDLWPDIAVETGDLSDSSILTRCWYRLAYFIYGQASHLTPVSASKMNKIVLTGVPARKITVVGNGVDMESVQNTHLDKREELGLKNKFVILYAGLIGVAQGVDNILNAAEDLRNNPNINFLIVGDGVKRKELEIKIKSKDLRNVNLLPLQPKADIPLFINTADVCFVPLANSNIKDAIPSKIFEAWGFQKPVILVAGGEAASLVKKVDGGVIVPPEKPELLKDAILNLLNNAELRKRYGAKGYSYVRENMNRANQAKIMENVLINVKNEFEKLKKYEAKI